MFIIRVNLRVALIQRSHTNFVPLRVQLHVCVEVHRMSSSHQSRYKCMGCICLSGITLLKCATLLVLRDESPLVWKFSETSSCKHMYKEYFFLSLHLPSRQHILHFVMDCIRRIDLPQQSALIIAKYGD